MRLLMFAFAAIGVGYAVGLMAFMQDIRPQAEPMAPEGDGVIVYTGGGGARIAAAMTLLSDGAGERLLISGVNPDTSKDRLSGLWKGKAETFSCCVDLGREAKSTYGNAAEAAQWAERNDYTRIILVTSDFHMPRAVAATERAMPETIITAYPVASGYISEDGAPTSLKAWWALTGEYTKFVLALIGAPFTAAAG